MLDGVIVGSAVARHLGPVGFGSFSNGLALVALLSPLIRLGLDRIVVRELVTRRDDRAEIFWSAVILQLAASIGVVVCLTGLAAAEIRPIASPNESGILIACIFGLAFEWTGVPRLLLEANVDSRWDVWTTVFWRFLFAGVRLWLVWQGYSAVHFAWAHSAMLILSSLTVFRVVHRLGLLPPFIKPSWRQITVLLRESWPLAIAAVSVTIYMNIDILMLHQLQTVREAGIYSAAVRMSSLFYFLPMAISASFFPQLTRLHAEDPHLFERQTQRFFYLNSSAAYVVTGVALLTFPAVMRLLFQDAYSDSISIFRVHVFSNLFVFAGVARGTVINLDRRHRFAMFSTFVAAILNVALNAWWIPIYAGRGAAVATVVSYGIAAVASTLIYPPTRALGFQQVRSLAFGPAGLLLTLYGRHRVDTDGAIDHNS